VTLYRSRSVQAGMLALAAVLTGPTFAPSAASAATLKPLVVQPSEVASAYGTGFKTLSMRPMRASDLAGISMAATTTALMKGYTGGYFSSFYRVSRSGVTLLTSGVSAYASATYPRAALEQTMKNKTLILRALQKQYISGVHIDWVSGIGEKAIKMSYSVKIPAVTPGGKPSTTQAITLVFSRGKFASSLNVSGRGSISSDQALAIAKRVDDRLQHAG
jgi:hypothetical protein